MRQARPRRPLVAPIDTRAFPSLLHALTGNNARTDGHAMLHGELADTGRGSPRNDIEMARLATNDAAEGDAGAMTAGTADKAIGQRKTERERSPSALRYGDLLEFRRRCREVLGSRHGRARPRCLHRNAPK